MSARAQDSWWDRNWKWAVPSGCLVVLLLFVGVGTGFAWFVMGVIRATDPYRESVAVARGSPALVDRLGEPIEEGWWLTGTVSVKNARGEADLTIPVAGPRGEAILRVVARKRDGRWRFDRIRADVAPGGERIDLIENRE